MPTRQTSIEEKLRRALGDGLLTQEPLKHHTTFRIGGPADYYFAARTPDQLVTALLTCLLLFRKGMRDGIQKVIDEKLEIRRVKHPQWRMEPTAGSYFKNLPPDWRMPGAKLSPGTHRVAAGQLLDECGVRGMRVGDAMVFPKHANIIVNVGHAAAADVLELAATMKRLVRERFKVELEEEVMFLGERPGAQRAAAAG